MQLINLFHPKLPVAINLAGRSQEKKKPLQSDEINQSSTILAKGYIYSVCGEYNVSKL